MWPVVWKASSTMLSSWSEAAKWKTEKMFFHPERMFAAWELTIWAMQRTTMSLIVGDLKGVEEEEEGSEWKELKKKKEGAKRSERQSKQWESKSERKKNVWGKN